MKPNRREQIYRIANFVAGFMLALVWIFAAGEVGYGRALRPGRLELGLVALGVSLLVAVVTLVAASRKSARPYVILMQPLAMFLAYVLLWANVLIGGLFNR